MFATSNQLRTKGTDILLTAARETGVKRFIAQSYCGWPYARVGGAIKTEADALDPDPPAELRTTLSAIRYLEQTVTGSVQPEGIVLRYGSFYGPGTGMLESAMLEQIRNRRTPLIGDGAGWWSFVHVDDAAAATVKALERGKPGSIYNITDDDPAQVRDWLPTLADIVGAKRPYHLPAWIARLVAGKPSGFDDDAGARGLERQGQSGTWLATGSSIMALGIFRDRPSIHCATVRRMSARAAAGRLDMQSGVGPFVGVFLQAPSVQINRPQHERCAYSCRRRSFRPLPA